VLVFDIGQSARSADVSEVWRAVSADSRCTLAAGSSFAATAGFQKEALMDDIEWMREQDERELGQARDHLLTVIGEHESRHHDGGCCLLERVNALAFFAHSLGLRADADETWIYIRTILEAVYEAHHH
jgi:hypothetical protein